MSRNHDDTYDDSDDELMFVFEMSDAEDDSRRVRAARPANPMAQLLELEDAGGSLPPPPLLGPKPAIKRKASRDEDDDDDVYRPTAKRQRPATRSVKVHHVRTKNMAIPWPTAVGGATAIDYFCRHSIESSCSPLRMQFHSLFVGSTQDASPSTPSWRPSSHWLQPSRNQFSY
ncbi:hypothetical protein SDRG_15673 [Saprolegnia diclina VS20]|uniref:Uncharacterized protein n=1 Tax=Saprolegnia diclina (strain VS20) TaxID=1156394 RepID=T0PZI6_SAPDV|nr:hypothetical protein SDRG_15673 [Saprolegnia diclina VS20]EQC26495.1 hypothetical protein SDRG_15673 [Saprolegnia diclina VS20]|eukprot:XP_008620074.1 hypothetical protein SDRG_15673 [Saprolegnia diclina VS20]